MSVTQRLINEYDAQITNGGPTEAVMVSLNDFRAIETENGQTNDPNYAYVQFTLFDVHANPGLTSGNSIWCCTMGLPPTRQFVLTSRQAERNDGHMHSDNCDHAWIQYHGLFEGFEYCAKCDARKGG